MKEKLLKHLPFLWFVALLAFIIGGSILYNGNPFTKIRLNKESVEYVQENYPEISGKVQLSHGGVYVGHYNMTPVFWASFSNPEDDMMHFQLMYDRNGNLIYDGYTDHYLKGGTIYMHLSSEYSTQVRKLFNDTFRNDSGATGVTISSIINSTSAAAYFENDSTGGWKNYAGPVLDIEKEYTVQDLAAEYGCIEFHFAEDKEQTKENLYQRLLQSKELLSENETPFSKFSITYKIGNGVYGITAQELFEGDLKQIVEERYVNYFSDEEQ